MTEVHGWICGPRIYEWKEKKWMVNPSSGPWPLKKNGDPCKRAGKKFWEFCDEFDRLPESEQKKCRIGGGCQQF